MARDGPSRLALDLWPIPLFKQGGRIAGNQPRALGLAQGLIKHPVYVMHGARRQAALPIATAALQQFDVSLTDFYRLKF